MRSVCVFAVIRDGEISYYYDAVASPTIDRELIWGSDAFLRWLEMGERYDQWDDEAEVEAGAMIDLDRRKLLWCAANNVYELPRVERLFDRLLETAWPGFEITRCNSIARIAHELALPPSETDFYDEREREALDRPQQIGASRDEEFDDEEFDDDDDEPFDDEEVEFEEGQTRAWVTVIEPTGKVHHRHVEELTWDLICGRDDEATIERLMSTPYAEMPNESLVTEAMWIDMPNREVRWWGGLATRTVFQNPELSLDQHEDSMTSGKLLPGDGSPGDESPELGPKIELLDDRQDSIWPGWDVKEAVDGYEEQCAAAGPSGLSLSDAQAAAHFTPWVLSTKRIDASALLSALGGSLKQTAARAMGCLTMVLCMPVVLFSLISGNWKAGGITIAILVGLAVIVFKVLEIKFKNKFGGLASGLSDEEHERPATAGPKEPSVRKKQLNQLLADADLPSVAEIEPHIDPNMSELASALG